LSNDVLSHPIIDVLDILIAKDDYPLTHMPQLRIIPVYTIDHDWPRHSIKVLVSCPLQLVRVSESTRVRV
jgi:hypothetical protein